MRLYLIANYVRVHEAFPVHTDAHMKKPAEFLEDIRYAYS